MLKQQQNQKQNASPIEGNTKSAEKHCAQAYIVRFVATCAPKTLTKFALRNFAMEAQLKNFTMGSQLFSSRKAAAVVE